MGALIYLAILVVAFYLLIVMPQRRRMQSMRQLQENLRVGDEIVTTSGIYGRVARLDESTADVEIAAGTVVKLARAAIAQRVSGDVSGGEAG